MTIPKSCVIIGSGMGGLALGALLARADVQVTVLEAHPELIGGYAHTLGNDDYTFTLGPRYLWSFGRDDIGHRFLEKCDLVNHVPMVELDRDGFDRIYIDDCEPISVPNGWDLYEIVLQEHFPEEASGVATFFQLCRQVFDVFSFVEARGLHLEPVTTILTRYLRSGRNKPFALFGLMWRAKWTLQQAFEHCRLSPQLQAVLYAHGMIFALPKESISFPVYVGGTLHYHRGCYYPVDNMTGFVSALSDTIAAGDGKIITGAEVVAVDVASGSISGVLTASGQRFEADVYVSNIDPRSFCDMIQGSKAAAKLPKYEYSLGLTSLFLGLRDSQALRTHFGPWNIWYSVSDTPGSLYESDPADEPKILHLNSPSVITGKSPPRNSAGATVTALAPSSYATFVKGIDSRHAQQEIVARHREAIMELITRKFVPTLSDVVDFVTIRTPYDNEQTLRAPFGNVYGKRLTPRGMFQTIPWKGVLPNLRFVGSAISFQGIAQVVRNACEIYGDLTGDRIP